MLTCTMHIQYGQSYKCAPSPTLPNDDRHNDAKHDLLAIKVLTSSRVSAMKSDGEWINDAPYLSWYDLLSFLSHLCLSPAPSPSPSDSICPCLPAFCRLRSNSEVYLCNYAMSMLGLASD